LRPRKRWTEALLHRYRGYRCRLQNTAARPLNPMMPSLMAPHPASKSARDLETNRPAHRHKGLHPVEAVRCYRAAVSRYRRAAIVQHRHQGLLTLAGAPRYGALR
jgi:hypothetical protein